MYRNLPQPTGKVRISIDLFYLIVAKAVTFHTLARSLSHSLYLSLYQPTNQPTDWPIVFTLRFLALLVQFGGQAGICAVGAFERHSRGRGLNICQCYLHCIFWTRTFVPRSPSDVSICCRFDLAICVCVCVWINTFFLSSLLFFKMIAVLIHAQKPATIQSLL